MNSSKIGIIVALLVIALGGWLWYRGGTQKTTEQNLAGGTMLAGDEYHDNGMVGGDAVVDDEYVVDDDTDTGGDGNAVETVDLTQEVGTTKTVTVKGGNFFFTPSVIKVKKGDTVKVTFDNVGGTHDFKIDAFKASTKKIGSGATETISFVASKTGSFEYYCSVGNHRGMGMKGTLIVE